MLTFQKELERVEEHEVGSADEDQQQSEDVEPIDSDIRIRRTQSQTRLGASENRGTEGSETAIEGEGGREFLERHSLAAGAGAAGQTWAPRPASSAPPPSSSSHVASSAACSCRPLRRTRLGSRIPNRS